MKKIKQITISRKSAPYLEHSLTLHEQKGWQRSSLVYESPDGFYSVDMTIEANPVIYTSITGVLLPQTLSAQNSALKHYSSGHFTNIQFSPSAVDNLKSLLESTDARLKVHSMWRYRLFGENEKMKELFLKNGFQPPHFHQDFFVPFKGRDGVREYDIEFSHSDDSFVNIVIDTRNDLDLSDDFIVYNPVSLDTGLTLEDREAVEALINQFLV
ncbi:MULTISPECIES: hypothetical protein [Vibrio]|uniref:hypothetical protein n=1 Tax=Vibrio TaxID=662 RepID=UPI000C9DB8F3|nr:MULTISPECIES: hypothetical protein [Vibrio]NGZ19065.1 hypothetical protein [Vibrio aestuarianus]PNH93285.1 hypothetical protein C1O24_19290 [Vibrio diazotrophicus]